MTNDTTPTPEAVTAALEGVTAILKDVTLAVSTDGTGTIYIMPELTPDSAVAIAARDKDMGWHKANPEIFEAMVDRFNAHEALAADLAAHKARADAAERALNAMTHKWGQADRDLTAERDKVAKLVEALIWTDMELAKLSGLWFDVSPRKQIRAIIAEVQG